MDLSSYRKNGFAIVENVLNKMEVADMISPESLKSSTATHARRGVAFANRSAIEIAAVASLARHANVKRIADEIIGKPSFAVRAILFDKVEGANWKVPWHQDLTIAVKERHEVAGYGPWSIKEDQSHVQPPSEILQRMVSIRLHLDDCGADNGPLRVIPQSHTRGRLTENEVSEFVRQNEEKVLTCDRGDAILMSPLLIHASSPSTSPSHRRVIHIDYASCELAPPLEWANRVS